MPKPAKKDELHIRLSQPAMERLKALEELSGFSGSRLIEEIIMAIYDILMNYAEFDITSEEVSSDDEAARISSMFVKAMETILDRIGYSTLYEEMEKEYKKVQKKSRKKEQR